MRNLAGVNDADKCIEEELYLAGISPNVRKIALHEKDSHWVTFEDGGRSEVPYSIYGRLRDWLFYRAWYYYVASCPDGLGLIYDKAVVLHEKKYPVAHKQYSTVGQVVRVYGDCTSPHPKTRRYSTLVGIEGEIVEARKKYPDIDWNAEESFGRSWLREIDGVKYIRLYHIDTQIGLNEFVGAITSGALVGKR